MGKKKLINDIVLSIQYSRLKEELSDSQTKIQEIKEEKINIFKDKRITGNEEHIKLVKKQLKSIEGTYPESKYLIKEKGQLNKKIQALSKYKDFELIKFNIAIVTVMDFTVEYKNTDDYLSNISEILFDDSKRIASIKKEVNKVHAYLTNQPTTEQVDKKDLVDAIPTAINAMNFMTLGKNLLNKVKKPTTKAFGIIKKHPKISVGLAIGMAAVTIGKSALSYHTKKVKSSRKLKSLQSEDLEFMLLTNALCLKLAKDYMLEVEYMKYFKNKMREINLIKQKTNKALYIKWFDRENNAENLLLLNRFDDYIISNIVINK